MNAPSVRERVSLPPVSSRPVRHEFWARRTFFASPCRFFIDVPLDMTGCIHAALRDAQDHGVVRKESGAILATDALFRGAILIEVDADTPSPTELVRIHDVELLARELPTRRVNLRAELDELVRWSIDLGHDVVAMYVDYQLQPPGIAQATEIFAALRAPPVSGER